MRRRGSNCDITLDLHGMHVDEAVLAVLRVVRSAANRGCSVEIIHGYGTGAVKGAVRALLRDAPEAVETWYGEDYNLPGLGGVTVVFLDE